MTYPTPDLVYSLLLTHERTSGRDVVYSKTQEMDTYDLQGESIRVQKRGLMKLFKAEPSSNKGSCLSAERNRIKTTLTTLLIVIF